MKPPCTVKGCRRRAIDGIVRPMLTHPDHIPIFVHICKGHFELFKSPTMVPIKIDQEIFGDGTIRNYFTIPVGSRINIKQWNKYVKRESKYER